MNPDRLLETIRGAHRNIMLLSAAVLIYALSGDPVDYSRAHAEILSINDLRRNNCPEPSDELRMAILYEATAHLIQKLEAYRSRNGQVESRTEYTPGIPSIWLTTIGKSAYISLESSPKYMHDDEKERRLNFVRSFLPLNALCDSDSRILDLRRLLYRLFTSRSMILEIAPEGELVSFEEYVRLKPKPEAQLHVDFKNVLARLPDFLKALGNPKEIVATNFSLSTIVKMEKASGWQSPIYRLNFNMKDKDRMVHGGSVEARMALRPGQIPQYTRASWNSKRNENRLHFPWVFSLPDDIESHPNSPLRAWGRKYKLLHSNNQNYALLPGLYDLTRLYGDLPFDEAVERVESVMQSGGGSSFEFYGFSLRQRLVLIFTPLISITFSVFLLLHASRARKLIIDMDLQSARNFPWFGIYPELGARIVSFATIVIVPPAVIAYLFFLGQPLFSDLPGIIADPLGRAAEIIGVTFIVALPALCAWIWIDRLRQRVHS